MAQAATGTPTEVLAGLVDRMTFHNPENGFCVLWAKARGQRDLVAVLAHAPVISAGEIGQATRSGVNDRTHGLQFRASLLKAGTGDRSDAANWVCVKHPTDFDNGFYDYWDQQLGISSGNNSGH